MIQFDDSASSSMRARDSAADQAPLPSPVSARDHAGRAASIAYFSSIVPPSSPRVPGDHIRHRSTGQH